jgi:hypothetical protein
LPIHRFKPIISNDITIPLIINKATLRIASKSLVIRALGCPRSLASIHNALWKNAQNIPKKNNASDTIKRIIPKFIPLCTERV